MADFHSQMYEEIQDQKFNSVSDEARALQMKHQMWLQQPSLQVQKVADFEILPEIVEYKEETDCKLPHVIQQALWKYNGEYRQNDMLALTRLEKESFE